MPRSDGKGTFSEQVRNYCNTVWCPERAMSLTCTRHAWPGMDTESPNSEVTKSMGVPSGGAVLAEAFRRSNHISRNSTEAQRPLKAGLVFRIPSALGQRVHSPYKGFRVPCSIRRLSESHTFEPKQSPWYLVVQSSDVVSMNQQQAKWVIGGTAAEWMRNEDNDPSPLLM